MSLGIYPVFNKKLAGAKFCALGEVLAHNFEALDKIAGNARLKRFTAFADNRPIPEGFDGDPDELKEVMGESTAWFDAADGRAAMQALADYIKTNPKAVEALDDAVGVVRELEEIVRVLAVADAEGA